MTDKPNADDYRYTARELRQVAHRSHSDQLRDELLELALRYELLAAHQEQRLTRYPTSTGIGQDKDLN